MTLPKPVLSAIVYRARLLIRPSPGNPQYKVVNNELPSVRL